MDPIEKSLRYLEKSISDGFWKPGDRLPNQEELGRTIGVSGSSVGKAVRKMAKNGTLTTRPRKGIWVARLQTDEAAEPVQYCGRSRHIQKWEQLKNRIVQNLFDRTFNETDLLPTLEEMRHRYGVSINVLKKSLLSLAQEGLITPYKKGYKPNLVSNNRHKTKILFLVQVDPQLANNKDRSRASTGYIFSTKGRMFFQEVELFCQRKNMAFEIWGYFFKNNAITFINPEMENSKIIEHPERYYGTILFKLIAFTPEYKRMFADFSGEGRPLVIIDESGNLEYELPRSRKKWIHLIMIACAPFPGRKIGHYLLELGHRDVAFISPWHKEQWCFNRYLGLCKAFESAGRNYCVRLFADNRFSSGEAHPEDPRIEDSEKRFPAIKDLLKTYTVFTDEQIEHISKRTTGTLTFELRNMVVGYFLQPLFEQALEHPTVTAWVCVDSNIALHALDFLKKKGIRVPEQISVAGFDDNFNSFEANLTNWNYDIPGIVAEAISFISNPSCFSDHFDLDSAYSGHLVVRGSTSPAKESVLT